MNDLKERRKYTSSYLTGLAAYASNTRTDVVDVYTPEEWIRLYDAYLASGWDFTPCQWAEWQRHEAVDCGLVPAWGDDERPIQASKRLVEGKIQDA